MPLPKPTRHKRRSRAMPQDAPARRVAQTEKQRQALQMRLAGASYEQVAAALGYRQRCGAWQAVQEALRKMLQEPADEVRKLELARLDSWLLGITPQIRAGSLDALDRGLKIMAQRTMYITGLKVPDRVDLRLTIQRAAQQVAAELGLSVEEVLAEAEALLRALDRQGVS